MIITKQLEVLDRFGRSTLVVLTTNYISEDYLNHLHIIEKAFNNFNFQPLDKKLTDIQDNKSTVKEKVVKQLKFFKYWNVAGKNEKSDTSVNKDNENVTANQFYFPKFANKLRYWYLPTCPLWNKLMTNNIENKVDALISKEITAQNIMEDINNKAQAEEFFRITMYSSF